MRAEHLRGLISMKALRGTGCFLLLMSVCAEALIELHAHFGIADFLGFNAVFGFFCCVLIIALTRLLGSVIKRKQDYYDAR